MIDLRSDTVTQPTGDMRKAIAEAEVGDDVFHDDPSVLRLEEAVAEILGKDDAMFTPTGVMANQTALRAHTSPGDVVLASVDAHIDDHELGAANALAGVTIRQLEGDGGTFTAAAIRGAVPEIPESLPSSLFQPVSLLAVENTHNAAGGTVWPLAQLRDVVAVATSLGMGTHLDGARLWNATAATGVTERDYATGFDTVSVCFSKGLGAPMGSALAGSPELISTARRFKQMYGGGFRQAGMMAAGALHALDRHRERLTEDHQNAARLAEGLADVSGIELEAESVESNMVYFSVSGLSASEFCDRWLREGVAALPAGANRIRIVTHLGVSPDDVAEALGAAGSVMKSH